MIKTGTDTLKTRKRISSNGKTYDYFDVTSIKGYERMPYSLRVLLENMLRFEDGRTVKVDDIKAIENWLDNKGKAGHEIAYRPARVLMQDFTGVPAVVDLAAMREGIKNLGGDPQKINPLTPVDLVIDHSVAVDAFGSDAAFKFNVEKEFERNKERYEFLKWGQDSFRNFRAVPPGTGICHQVNLEYLAQSVWLSEDEKVAYPDTLVGTDSHTTMINGLGVLGWGVGGIEAEAAMLGQPISMLIPEVIGFKITGKPKEGTTATDLVLMVTQMLRAKGVVGKFVEFYGDGLNAMSLADRATIANMAPEYGATCGFFPIDKETCRYLRFTGRDEARVDLVEAYCKANGFWRSDDDDLVFTDTLELDLSAVEPALAGPKRPQDRVLLSKATDNISDFINISKASTAPVPVEGMDASITSGDVVIAAITSCTNTSNPSVMVAAGLVARNAREKGLKVQPWVKTSLAPGSQVVTDYLERAGLQDDLDALGFNLVGYGCTTCIGNSGPLPDNVKQAVESADLTVASVLSGNRNFEGRVNPNVKANYLASPPLVVAYALLGTMNKDITTVSLGKGLDGKDVYLKDIWPSNKDISEAVEQALTPEMFKDRYGDVFKGPPEWQAIKTSGGELYDWQADSTYVRNPPYFDGMTRELDKITEIKGAYPLAIFGDSITTDHISPAGAIKKDSPAGAYLIDHDIAPSDFNSYGSRRGNHEVMMRGTFANIRIKNQMLNGVEGGMTRHIPSGAEMPIYDAAMNYKEEGRQLIVIGGKEYGTGSSRDWAAKGTILLGVRAVIVESFERIHRSNLVGMGVLPLQFKDGQTRHDLDLKGDETFDVSGFSENLSPGMNVTLTVHRANGSSDKYDLLCRIDTLDEVDYFKNGGILHNVLRSMA